jgi:hypothetical protein
VGELNIRFYLSDHALQRMSQRGVNKQLIKRALELGSYIEQGKRLFKVVTDFLVVVISYSSNQMKSCRIVTCYKPKQKKALAV